MKPNNAENYISRLVLVQLAKMREDSPTIGIEQYANKKESNESE